MGMEEGDWDLIGVPWQGVIQTHGENRCRGQHCVIHNPSDHHMKTWPLQFLPDRAWLAIRVCPHRMGHPDPDSVDYMVTRGIITAAFHDCDGCCTL